MGDHVGHTAIVHGGWIDKLEITLAIDKVKPGGSRLSDVGERRYLGERT
jgi:hypothetical protein